LDIHNDPHKSTAEMRGQSHSRFILANGVQRLVMTRN
jgi:hypothetical protein